jgi:predicted nucleic acid-binding protein
VSGEPPSRGLVDTNIVIHLPRLQPDELPDELVICAVTLAELSAGPHHAPDVAERARRINLLQHVEQVFEPLPFDAEAARCFGLVRAAVFSVGRVTRRRLADLQIAATALANALPLYTTNPKDFVGLEDLVDVRPVNRPT